MANRERLVLDPSEIAQETRALAVLAHKAIRREPESRTIDLLLKRLRRFERRLIHYTTTTGAPLSELRTWLSSVRRALVLRRDSS